MDRRTFLKITVLGSVSMIAIPSAHSSLLLFLRDLFGYYGGAKRITPPIKVQGLPTIEKTGRRLRVLVYGDAGTGNKNQKAVAKAMAEIAKRRGCDLALALGDNFYENAPRNEYDPKFNTHFESIYSDIDVPFLSILGNHDQSAIIPGAGIRYDLAAGSIKYTNLSKKWIMPSQYYQASFPVKDSEDLYSSIDYPLIDIIAIDSNVFAPQQAPDSSYRPDKPYAIEMKKFLKDSLSKSKARWKFVLSHHPYWNNGHHGSAGSYYPLAIGLATGYPLKSLMEEVVLGKADFVLSGHDHSLQWMVDPSKKTQLIVSGAAGKTNGRGSANHPALVEAYNTLGFFWMEIRDNNVVVSLYTVDSTGKPTLAYERRVPKP